MDKPIDITTFASIDNKAANAMVNIMTNDGKIKHLKSLIKIIVSCNNKMKELYDSGIYSEFFYKLVFNYYKEEINKLLKTENEIYSSYGTNILHAKYRMYMKKIDELMSEYRM